MNNTNEYQVSNYEGVTVKFGDSVSKEVKDRIVTEIQPERFKIWETLARQSFFIEGFEVVTLPLNKDGYVVKDKFGKCIYVNSKLPKVERARIVRRFIHQSKELNEKELNDKTLEEN